MPVRVRLRAPSLKGPLAHAWLEQRTHNPLVQGSTPWGPTNYNLNMIPFELSTLQHTWFIDIDGTIFKHEGLWEDGEDTLLPGVQELWNTIPADDCIILTTGRNSHFASETEQALKKFKLRYDKIIFDLPVGERIIVNDTKPSGLETAIAWNVKRNQGYI